MKYKENNMNVLYMATYSNMSGANRSMIGIIEYVKEWGVTPFVILPKHGPVEMTLSDDNIPFKIIPSAIWVNPGDPFPKNEVKRLTKWIINILADIRVRSYCKKNKIELIHINTVSNPVGARYAYKKGIPLVWHIREMVEKDHNWKFYNDKKTYEILNKASKVIAISNSVANRFAPFLKDNMTVIYNGIKCKNNIAIKRNILGDSTVKVTCAGRILPEKGQMEALKAFCMIKKFTKENIILNLYGDVGDKKYYNEILEYTRENNLEDCVIIHGYCSNMNEIWSSADIAMVCSAAEAFGRVTVEAMMGGALVIGSDSAGTTELIEDMKTGLLYRQGDIDDLANKLSYALKHIDEMRDISERGQQYMVDNMTAEINAKRVFQVYKSCIRERN